MDMKIRPINGIAYMFLASVLFMVWPLEKSSGQNISPIEIFGNVIDFQTGIPISGVQIQISKLIQTISDSNGKYRIDHPLVGQDPIKIEYLYDGYYQIAKTIVPRERRSFNIDISLVRLVVELDDDVIVTARRIREKAYDIPTMVTSISVQEIQEQSISQTPELLRGAVGVNIQKTNQGGGSPIIRGMKSNKILLMVDGIRMNNSTYRGGNYQYLNTIDAQIIERIEVVHGPNAVMYGSDALGGVVHVITKIPDVTRQSTLGGGVNSQLSTADATRMINAQVEYTNPRWAGRFSGGYKAYGNVQRGGQGGKTLMDRLMHDTRATRILNKIQSPNNYSAYDINTSFRFRPNASSQVTASYQHNRQNDVPRYDVIEAQTDSIRLFSPQERDLIYLKYVKQTTSLISDNITSTLSWHRQFERRRRLKNTPKNENVDQYGVQTFGALFQINKLISDTFRLIYGIDVYYDRVSTGSYDIDIFTQQMINTIPLYPDNSTFIQYGWYLQNNWMPTPRWAISPGIRLSRSQLKSPFLDDPTLPIQFGVLDQSSQSLTGSLGIRYSFLDGINLVSNIGQGFRTPNLDDVSKLGLGKGGTIYEIPNGKLKPEKTLSFDGGIKVKKGRVQTEVFGFYNIIKDLLIRKPTSINGSTIIVNQGDTLSLFHKENSGKAYTTGFEINSEIKIDKQISLTGRLSYTYGKNISDNEPLASIPPLSGRIQISWLTGGLKTDSTYRFASAQNRLSSEDKLDLRIPEGGSPLWQTLNLKITKKISKPVSLSLTINNIFDLNYREHLSGLNAPGRNFLFGIRSIF